MNFVKKCTISDSVSLAAFDHKAILLDFTQDKIVSKLYINRTILSNPRTDDVVLAAVADTYLSHTRETQDTNILLDAEHVFGPTPQGELERQRIAVGTYIHLLKEHNDLLERKVTEKDNNLIDLLLAEKNTEIIMQRDLIWDVNRFSKLALTCDDDYFLEALASNVKGCVISFQTWVRKTENKEKSLIITRLNKLKVNYEVNSFEICRLEEKLKQILDTETLLKVRSMKMFSCLNGERPTPLFLSLAKSSNKSSNLSAIRQDNGKSYDTQRDQVEGIVNFFENIYLKSVNESCDYTNCIEKFLGPTVMSSPIVKNSILTDPESVEIDGPPTIEELDLSIEKCNVRSAPGIDGLSNAFIKKYWHYFRIPLLKYANTCFEKKILTSNFRAAAIKLIPKKGDITNIKNWRPISLLSNMYKIICNQQ